MAYNVTVARELTALSLNTNFGSPQIIKSMIRKGSKK